jgi:hypothetical protein
MYTLDRLISAKSYSLIVQLVRVRQGHSTRKIGSKSCVFHFFIAIHSEGPDFSSYQQLYFMKEFKLFPLN